MSLLFDCWFPRGGAGDTPKAFTALDCNDVHHAPVTDQVLALPDVALRCSQTIAPDGETAWLLTKYYGDPGAAAGPKVQLVPAATTQYRDPITNWDGYSDSRRWYRFKVCLPESYVYEKWAGNSQRHVLFQVHDTVDTTPADYDTSPPLWLIEYPDESFYFVKTYCTAEQTTVSNFSVVPMVRIALKRGVPAEFVIYAKWAHDSTGEITIWMDRRVIFREIGQPNCKNDSPTRGGSGVFSILASYAKHDLIDRSVYHYGLQIGDERYATYNEFAAACGAGSELEMTNAESVAVCV